MPLVTVSVSALDIINGALAFPGYVYAVAVADWLLSKKTDRHVAKYDMRHIFKVVDSM